MSPADELRAAAQKLRDTAATATPGPWIDASTGDDGAWPVMVVAAAPHPDEDRGEPVLIVHETVDEEIVGPGDVAWIALASPALAGPLADLLEKAADHLCITGAVYCIEVNRTLAVARAINGGAR